MGQNYRNGEVRKIGFSVFVDVSNFSRILPCQLLVVVLFLITLAVNCEIGGCAKTENAVTRLSAIVHNNFVGIVVKDLPRWVPGSDVKFTDEEEQFKQRSEASFINFNEKWKKDNKKDILRAYLTSGNEYYRYDVHKVYYFPGYLKASLLEDKIIEYLPVPPKYEFENFSWYYLLICIGGVFMLGMPFSHAVRHMQDRILGTKWYISNLGVWLIIVILLPGYILAYTLTRLWYILFRYDLYVRHQRLEQERLAKEEEKKLDRLDREFKDMIAKLQRLRSESSNAELLKKIDEKIAKVKKLQEQKSAKITEDQLLEITTLMELLEDSAN